MRSGKVFLGLPTFPTEDAHALRLVLLHGFDDSALIETREDPRKGPLMIKSIEGGSKFVIAWDRQHRQEVIYLGSGEREATTPEVVPAEGDHG
jgi:hypothetical protein